MWMLGVGEEQKKMRYREAAHAKFFGFSVLQIPDRTREISLCNETNQERDLWGTSKVFSRSGVSETFIVAPDRINSSKSWLNGPSLCGGKWAISRLITFRRGFSHAHRRRRQIQQKNLGEKLRLSGGECQKAKTQIARRVQRLLPWPLRLEKVPCGYLDRLLTRFARFPCRITSCCDRSCPPFSPFHLWISFR